MTALEFCTAVEAARAMHENRPIHDLRAAYRCAFADMQDADTLAQIDTHIARMAGICAAMEDLIGERAAQEECEAIEFANHPAPIMDHDNGQIYA
jgi:hypothetical protein